PPKADPPRADNYQLSKHAMLLAAGIAGMILFLPLGAEAQGIPSSQLAAIQAAPLVGPDIIQKLPAPLQNLLQAGVDLNKSAISRTPPVLSGKGEWLSRTAQEILRAAISLAIALIAWLVVIATHAVSLIASVVIGIINWLLAFGRTLL
ncbi:MAG: hypothetical protein HYZ07_01900, partial [Candidatus Harrisonbacteria bacterium]|nr:hypothetical protein [Candidatus Harrisonbacteria bacterium]